MVLPLLHWLGEDDMDIDEIECIVANLIFSGFVKGKAYRREERSWGGWEAHESLQEREVEKKR
jgi:hypothetical protein